MGYDLDFKTVKWDSNRIRKEFGKRNLSQVLESKEFHYGGCYDKNLVIGHLSIRSGIQVHQALMSIWKPFGGIRLRAGVEINLDGQDYVFHPSDNGNDFSKGSMPYKKVHKLCSPRILRAKMTDSLDKSWVNQFGFDYLSQFSNIFPELSIEHIFKCIENVNS